MQSALTLLLLTSALGQIESSRPEVRPLQMKYRLTVQVPSEPTHVSGFVVGSPAAVGRWVVLSLGKWRGVAFAGDGARRDDAEKPWADCIDEGLTTDACGVLLAYNLDTGRTLQLTPPLRDAARGRWSAVSLHCSIDQERCAVVVDQYRFGKSKRTEAVSQFLWDWNIEEGIVKPVGEWDPAGFLRLHLDPNCVDIFPVSRKPSQEQTVALLGKPHGPLTRLVIKEPLREVSGDGSMLAWWGRPVLIPQGDRHSFVLYDSRVEFDAANHLHGRFDCFDPSAPNGRRWTLTAPEILKAINQRCRAIYPVGGQSESAPSMVLSAQSDVAEWLVSVDKQTGRIQRVTQVANPPGKEGRYGPILFRDGSRAVWISETEFHDGRPPDHSLITVDPKSGKLLSRVPITGLIEFIHEFFALDSQGRALITTSGGLGRISPGAPASYENLFGLDPLDLEHPSSEGQHARRRISEAGFRALDGARRLSKLALSGLRLTDPMLAELGRLPRLETLELVRTGGEPTKFGVLTKIRSLVLLGDVDEASVRQLARLPKLEELVIQLDSPDSNNALIQLGLLTSLKSLRLTRTFGEGLKARHLQSLRNLTSLQLGYLSVGDDDLAALAKLQKLERLDFREGSGLTGAGVRRLKDLPRLVDLRMSLNTVGDVVFDQIVTEAASFSHLKRLRLADENTLSANVLGRLGKLNGLTNLDLDQFGIENNAAPVDGLAMCRKLEDLPLANYGFKPSDMSEVLKVPNLKRLDLSNAERWETDPREIGRIKGLEELNLYSSGPPRVRLTDGCLAGFSGLTNLKKVCLSGNPISDAGLASLAKLKNLEQLALAHTRVTDRGLFNLSRMEHLAELDLFNTAITDDGLQELQKLPQLSFLDLGMTQITDAGLKQLSAIRLRRLNLRANSITDAGLKGVAAIEPLEELDLSYTDITDAGLAELKRLKHLRTLSLAGTNITDAGIKALTDLPELTTLRLGR